MRVPVFNQNGGGGKTATVVNPGTVLARQKKPALLIDLNPPHRLSAIHGGVWGKVDQGRFHLRQRAERAQAADGETLRAGKL